MTTQTHPHPHIVSALRTLDIEAKGITQLKELLSADFVDAVELFCRVKGRVIVCGMGKSGHVGRKIAATLSSTGTPAFFVHPAEAIHGDLGMITKDDVVLAISNSGEVSELITLLPHIRRLEIPIVALTGRAESTLGKHADCVISSHVEVEACPLNLAPTASTTAQLALGDALAIACLEHRGFKAGDFAASHPGGALGRKLLTKVSDVMRPRQAAPVLQKGASFLEMMNLMSQFGLGVAIEVNDQEQAVGIFTDGDLRRILSSGVNPLELTPTAVMQKNPKTIDHNAMAVDAAALMEEYKITSLIVVNASSQIMGMINTNDLLRSKVI